jgi:hypothetical protein
MEADGAGPEDLNRNERFVHIAGDTDGSGMTDELMVELNGVRVDQGVKGPDPEVWAEGYDLLRPAVEEDLTTEVKGPDVSWGDK